jgi:hypothetical protein
MIVSVRHDFNKLIRTLDDLGRRQMPFAAALALTETAHAVQAAETDAIATVFDRPTPFTQRAIGVTPARKERLEAVVFVKRVQAGYLGLEETGGERTPQPGKPVVIPGAIPLDAYGNIPRGALRRFKSRRDVFVGTINGVTGFWQRGPFHSLRLIASFHRRADYRARFGYGRRLASVVNSVFPAALGKRLEQAMASAKP